MQQLVELYSINNLRGHKEEFQAYRILNNSSLQDANLIQMIKEFTPAQRNNEFITHALAVRKALLTQNYARFFVLYEICPNMGSFLMQDMCETMRLLALRIICAGYRPSLPVDFVKNALAFGGMHECVDFLESNGVVFLAQEKVG